MSERRVPAPGSGGFVPEPGRLTGPFLVPAGLAVTWRAGAYLHPSSLIGIEEPMLLPLTLLGLFFLASGTFALLWRPDRATRLFFVYGFGGCIHWGGSIGAADPDLELGLFFGYLAGTAVGEAAFLHLALCYPEDKRVGRLPRILLYTPGGAAILAAPLAGMIPEPATEGIAGVLLLVSTLFGIAAGVIFLVRFFRTEGKTRRAAGLGIIAFGVAAGSTVSLLGAAAVLPGPPDAYNLALAVIPAALAVAVVRRR